MTKNSWESALIAKAEAVLRDWEARDAAPQPAAPTRDALAAMIDHTLLKQQASLSQLDVLCAEAAENRFASVCVNPVNVRHCAQALAEAGIPVCSVVGFPFGASRGDVKAFETEKAIGDGATEIDMVLNLGAMKSEQYALVRDDVAAVATACHAGGAHLKVIIEACLLTQLERVLACLLCVEAEADFVKTSTGLSTGGATLEDVSLMRATVGPEIGVKAAGGIRTYETACAMIGAGATRIGASSGIRIIADAPQS